MEEDNDESSSDSNDSLEIFNNCSKHHKFIVLNFLLILFIRNFKCNEDYILISLLLLKVSK